jgi:ribosome-associated protein
VKVIKNNNHLTSTQLTDIIVKGMQEKKASDIAILDLRDIKNSVVDFFVICSANSDTQVDAISDSIEEQVYKDSQQLPTHREGKMNKEWILLDYADIVAHVFRKDKRGFYSLEDLWGDAKITYVQD